MSDKSRIHSMLDSVGIKNTAYSWPEQDGNTKVPPLPYAVYYETGDTVCFADGFRYAAFTHYAIELWEKEPNQSMRNKLGDAIEATFGAYSKDTRSIPTEQAIVTTYDFTIIPEKG